VLEFDVALDYSGDAVGAGLPVKGSFIGLSISLPLTEALIGRDAKSTRPEFLNLMSTLRERGGPPTLRVGGTAQEKAYIFNSIDDGHHSTHCEAAGEPTQLEDSPDRPRPPSDSRGRRTGSRRVLAQLAAG